jgi:glycine cleavage system H lipoate-binding protein
MVALFVLGTIVLFLAADAVVLVLQRRKARALEPAAEAPVTLPSPRPMPGGMFVHPSHVWLTVDPQGLVRVGLDELAQRLLGRVESVRFPAQGMRIEAGQTLFTVQLGSATVPIPAPVTGTIEASQIPQDGSGPRPEAWMVAIRPERLGEEIRPLRVAEEAGRWLAREFGRLSEVLHGLRLAPAAATMPDGGEPVDGLLKVLDEGGRQVVVHEFFGAQS